jgi:NAD(P)-dependent dehydrogenase (short-subunit alcohol dehydrogenase family)
MNKTILITGTSSGIGRAAVKHFSDNGWNVAATMRNPDKEQEIGRWKNVKLYALDVTDQASIDAAITSAIADFGGIDAVCNNAGYGAVGIFEKGTDAQIRKQFDTNVFGCMNVVRGILPHFRMRKAGTIINVTSMGGRITFPLYSVYHATKWAMEGFTEALAFEMRPLGIKVRCVEPGPIKTDFNARSQDLFVNDAMTDYSRYETAVYANIQKEAAGGDDPKVVAKAIYKAATDSSWKLRYPIGGLGPALLVLRNLLPNATFFKLIRTIVEKGF